MLPLFQVWVVQMDPRLHLRLELPAVILESLACPVLVVMFPHVALPVVPVVTAAINDDTHLLYPKRRKPLNWLSSAEDSLDSSSHPLVGRQQPRLPVLAPLQAPVLRYLLKTPRLSQIRLRHRRIIVRAPILDPHKFEM
jgi:hypothetical protein